MLTPSETAILLIYYSLLGMVGVYAVHRYHLVRLRRRVTSPALPAAPHMRRWPRIAVQLPIYNEPNVVERLIDAVAALRYPGALEIQVLDDSTDHTSDLVAARVRALRGCADIRHLRRSERAGFKAGALAFGMSRTDAELFAVFDADFVPPPDTLLRMVPCFEDEKVGMVQARWEHLNRSASMITRVQAIYLDAHFAVESAARFLTGRLFNFNGTAGIWRRTAIEQAGGWSAATLTEDLDLSYRAQLAGWRFVFLPDFAVPSELPSAMSGFHDQQHRWAKGSIQTARRLLPRIMAAPIPRKQKVEAFFHLTNNCAYLLTLLLALFTVPALCVRLRHGLEWVIPADALPFLVSTGSVLAFYAEGQRQTSRRFPTTRELLAILPLGIGLCVRNSAAVLEGLFHSGGYFNRTPKRGNRPRTPIERKPPIPLPELLLAIFFASAIVAFAAMRQILPLPFLLLFASGFGHCAVTRLLERSRYAHITRKSA